MWFLTFAYRQNVSRVHNISTFNILQILFNAHLRSSYWFCCIAVLYNLVMKLSFGLEQKTRCVIIWKLHKYKNGIMCVLYTLNRNARINDFSENACTKATIFMKKLLDIFNAYIGECFINSIFPIGIVWLQLDWSTSVGVNHKSFHLCQQWTNCSVFPGQVVKLQSTCFLKVFKELLDKRKDLRYQKMQGKALPWRQLAWCTTFSMHTNLVMVTIMIL